MEEVWKDIKGYEGLYQVSNLGRIKSLRVWAGNKFTKKYKKREKILKQGLQKNGYCFILLYKGKKPKTFRVHRLVAQAFIENPNMYSEVNHKNKNKQNNNVDNLEWCTRNYNMIYGGIDKKKLKKVLQFNKDGVFIKEWDSIINVCKILDINHSSIVNNCRGRRHSAGGYIWRYKN